MGKGLLGDDLLRVLQHVVFYYTGIQLRLRVSQCSMT